MFFGMKLIMNTPGWRQRWHQRATPGASFDGDGSGWRAIARWWLGTVGMVGTVGRVGKQGDFMKLHWSFRTVHPIPSGINWSTYQPWNLMKQWTNDTPARSWFSAWTLKRRVAKGLLQSRAAKWGLGVNGSSEVDDFSECLIFLHWNWETRWGQSG